MASKKAKNNPQSVSPPKEEEIPVNQVSVFEKYGIKIALGIIFLIAFVCFKDFLLQHKIYLFKDIGSDSLNASWPWMSHSADYIAQNGVPSWSFSMGMGQNILSFSFYDPFDYILYLFGRDNMPYLIVYKELVKVLLAGFLFFKYLRLLNFSNYSSTIGAMVYAFSGYMILGSGWFLFSFEVFNAALLLLCFELLYQKGKWQWFALPIFLIGISRPFNFWMYAIFLVSYILFRLVQDGQKIISKETMLMFGKVIGVSILGIGISAPVFLEHIQVILDSPRGSGPDSYSAVLSSQSMFRTPDKLEFGTGMMRMFSNDILGSGIKFKGWQNFLEAPVMYCGIPCLLLFSQYFQFLKKPVKRAAIILISIWFLPVLFPYFRQAFWLFSGDYYRTYSFLTALIFIFFSISALDKIISQQKVNLMVLLVTLGVFLCLLNYPYFKGKDVAVDGGIKFFANILLPAYAGIIYFIGKTKNNLNYKYALIGCLFLELCYFSYCTTNRRDNVTVKDLSQKVGYNDYSIEAINFLKQTDKSFYRIDKNYFSSPAIHGSLNDAMVQGYYGTSSYNPFNQKYYIDYLKTMGIINKVNELESRWSPGLGNRFILESLNDVKYMFTKTGYSQPVWRVTHDSIAKFGDVLVLRNKYVLPFGFGYNKYLKLSDFEKLSLTQKDLVSTKACVLNDEDVSKVNGLASFDLKDTLPANLFTFDILKANIDSLKKSALQIDEFKQTSIKAFVAVPSNEVLYTSLPYDKGWSVTDNGNSAEKLTLSNGMTGIFLAKGAHKLEFVYTSRNYKKGQIISIVAILIFISLIFINSRKRKAGQNAIS
jgi:uncharacterized membrane protein YfhO